MLTLQPNHQVMFHLSQLSCSLSASTTQVINGLKTLCAKKIDSSHEIHNVICNESLDEAVKNCNIDMIAHLPKIHIKPDHLNGFISVKNVREIEELIGSLQMISSHKTPQPKKRFLTSRQISYVSTDSFDENKRLGFQRIPSIQKNGSVYIFTSRNLPPALLQHSYQPHKLAHQKRGFKTHRVVVKEREGSHDLLSQVANLFRPKPEVKAPGMDKLVDAKMSVDAVAAALTKVYGEGYNAGKTMSKLRKFRWFVYGMLTVSLIIGGRALMYRINFSISEPIKQVLPEDINVTFADVRGSEEVKKELITVVNFLKNPKKFMALGARLPKGVLLVGEPGVGKTLLARAVAGEARVPFFYASGSEFDEILVGEGARRIRNLFRIAKANAPCVIFLDEIDSVGGSRTKSSIHPYANQSINQLLSEMDGFQPNEGVVVLAATNRASDLDKALVRPGRFDMSIQVPRPRKGDRRDIIQYYLQKIACRNIDIETLVKMTAGWNGATLENMLNWAAILAATENSEYVHMHHIMNAYDRIVLGVSWGSANASELQKELRRTAYHEAGHTLVSMLTPGCSPIHKVTIEARGSALGHTASLFDEEIMQTKAALRATLDSCFGGQVAEEIIYGTDEVSTGCSSDLEKATTIAKIMVKKYGMGVTNRHLEDKESLSGEAQTAVDKDIEKILNDSKERAKNVLLGHAGDLHKIAGALLEYKTLTKSDLMQLLGTPDEANTPNDQ